MHGLSYQFARLILFYAKMPWSEYMLLRTPILRSNLTLINRSLTVLVLAVLNGLPTMAPAAANPDLTPDQREEVKLKSEKWGILRQKAEKLSRENKKEEALVIFEQLLAERKALGLDLDAEYALLGGVLTELGRQEEAVKVYKDMLAARESLNGKDDPQVIYALDEYAKSLEHFGKKGEAGQLRSRIARIQKETAARPVFGKITSAPGSASRLKEAEQVNSRGEQLVKADLQDKAYLYFDRAVQLNPSDPRFLRNRAETLSWKQDFAKAMADLNKAIKLKPDFARAYVDRAFVHQNLKQYKQAIADFEKAYTLNGKDIDAMGSRAKLLDEMGKHEEAVAGYTRVIQTDPSQYWPYIQRSVAYASMKRFKEAEDDLTVLINRAPGDTDYYEYRAGVYIKSGDLKKALNDYNKMIELSPQNSYFKEKRAALTKQLNGQSN